MIKPASVQDLGYLLKKFRVLWLGKVLEVAEVGDKFGIVHELLSCKIIKIGRIRKTLHELGVVNKENKQG